MDIGSTALDESSAINFNPPGTPYGGVEDGDRLDTYPPIVKGLVYVSGNVVSANTSEFNGVVVIGGTWNGSGSMTFTYDDTFHADPPPSFGSVTDMIVSQGTWRQTVD